MKSVGKLAAIEKRLSMNGGGGECTAYYKAGRGDMDGVQCTLAEAFEAARRGELSSISFTMTKDETAEWLKHETAKFKPATQSEKEQILNVMKGENK